MTMMKTMIFFPALISSKETHEKSFKVFTSYYIDEEYCGSGQNCFRKREGDKSKIIYTGIRKLFVAIDKK